MLLVFGMFADERDPQVITDMLPPDSGAVPRHRPADRPHGQPIADNRRHPQRDRHQYNVSVCHDATRYPILD